MKLLKAIGWIFIPFIMIFLFWDELRKSRRIYGAIWTVFIAVFMINNLNEGPPSPGKEMASLKTDAQIESLISSDPILDIDPLKVEEIIKQAAELKWKDDYKMRVYEINKQIKAYNELTYISKDNKIKNDILKRAYDKWSYDFAMVLYEYKKQLNAYEQLNK